MKISSTFIKFYQLLSNFINFYQVLSTFIKFYQPFMYLYSFDKFAGPDKVFMVTP